MKSILKINHLISRKLNGIINQIFAGLISYIVFFWGNRSILSYGRVRISTSIPFSKTCSMASYTISL